jgi:sugar phosphate isomerase/epimerase
MSAPRLLLVPEFTEIQWTIRPDLEAWAEVASYDPPGVGDEPPPLTRDAIAERGLEEVSRRGWERFFVVADGWAIAPALRIASRARHRVQGLALGHARLSDRLDGPRAPMNRAVYEGMTELIRNDALAFIRHGIVQGTAGSIDEAVAEQMVERFPEEGIQAGWEELTRAEDFAEELEAAGVPLLLGKHEGCLMSTDEGYEDAVEAFPEARTVVTLDACCVDPGFAEALHEFCIG